MPTDSSSALANVHAQNLHANKVIGWGKDDEGHLRPIEYPDYRARQRAADSGWKLLGTEVPAAPPERRPARITSEQFRLFKNLASEENLALAIANKVIEIIPDEETAAEETAAAKAVPEVSSD